MNTLSAITLRTGLASAIVFALAAANFLAAPDKALIWLIAGGTMAIIAFVTIRTARSSAIDNVPTQQMDGAAIAAAALLALALGLTLLRGQGIVDGETNDRLIGIGIGLVLASQGNALPKTLRPLTESRCSPANAEKLQRFAGWAVVLAGLGFALAWAVLPISMAANGAMAVCLIGVAATVWRCRVAFNA